ncbi:MULTISPECIES: TetR/AcrR family transcriptional regulator [unclassified Rhizobium]|uniref:TetR/AcrR family transcriptional regulator n=1 Tax=unclassified Rhizobium TaxID=2613769 RepID=UPI000EA88363|nr:MULTISPECIES: TetR/AcrR family transcriptional regulator [unclassified Rhizobium]AYG67496.1 TetR/AcrR family transcriptional regulator [Rhizobium sp. CCGE531]AYG73890.1 TetR/AcrR family transcriptional regulator [Rhizobium sp. CCGE532]
MSETANAILDAAEERIRDAGYSGFSYRDVATDVGVKASSVHYHFPAKEKLAAAVARRYTDRFLDTVDRKAAAGSDIVQAWRDAFREALQRDGRMCLCGAMAATSHDLAAEVRDEVKRFFLLGIEKLTKAGLSGDAAIQALVTLEGAMLAATLLDDPALFERGTAAIV